MPDPQTEAMFSFLATHGLPPYQNPFATTPAVQVTLLSSIARGEVGPQFPWSDRVPAGTAVQTMCKAVGVTPQVLRSSLQLGQELFDRWLRGEQLVEEELPHGITIAGIRHVFGTIEYTIARGHFATNTEKELTNA